MKRLALCLLICALAGCGYEFRHQRSNLPPEITTIAIPMFKNATNEIRLESIVTDQVRYQFSQSQILKIVPEAEADVVLLGSVSGVSSDDISLTDRLSSSERRISVRLSARLVEQGSGKVLYQGSVSQHRSYSLGGATSPSSSEARTEALRLVARDAAQIIHDGVLQNF
jgi:outer membrane lipopolysaccharide assembly protein LptE/RlpB